MPANLTDNKLKSSIFAFTPRQVLLGSQTMKHRSDTSDLSDGTNSLNLEQKVLLHQSIAHYLELHGFSKTLKKFRSEARIEKDNLNGLLVDLEEMCLKYIKISKDVRANKNNQKEQGKHSKKDEGDSLVADMENKSKKKKKKKKKKTEQSDSDAGAPQPGTYENLSGTENFEELTNGLGPESKVTSEDKDNDKKCIEKKKKKRKSASESLSNEENESADAETVIDETEKRSKDKKKKKDKSSNDGNDSQFESTPMVTEVKLRDNASSDAKTVSVEMEKQSKDKKKRRNNSSSDGNVEGLQIEDHTETNSKKDSFNTSNKDVTGKKKKDSEKRRRLTSEENDVLPLDGKAGLEPKRRKIENLNESKRGQQSTKMNANLKGDLISDKANIGETIQGSDQLRQPSGEQFKGEINGDLGNTGEKSSIRRSHKKRQKGSVEPKEGKAFQRVKADEVVFADERLQDNSYWAKNSAESGYGAKAEEILGQVRGRDFRHEKTKEKRGTYRGGQVDSQSHSIKFNDSDDNE